MVKTLRPISQMPPEAVWGSITHTPYRSTFIEARLNKANPGGKIVLGHIVNNMPPEQARDEASNYIRKNGINRLFLEANLGSPGKPRVVFEPGFFQEFPGVEFMLFSGTNHAAFDLQPYSTLENVSLDAMAIAQNENWMPQEGQFAEFTKTLNKKAFSAFEQKPPFNGNGKPPPSAGNKGATEKIDALLGTDMIGTGRTNPLSGTTTRGPGLYADTGRIGPLSGEPNDGEPNDGEPDFNPTVPNEPGEAGPMPE